MTLATQGKAIADIEIVQIGDPANPTSVGVLEGVGGRLKVVEGVLYGASPIVDRVVQP